MKLVLSNLLMRSNKTRTASEVAEELQFHLEMLERKYTQQGMSDAHAKAAALKRFGNLARYTKHCVSIRQRNSLVRRLLKTSFMLMALSGLSISVLSSEYKVARIGHVLIMIAIAGRLLLYVRGLIPSTPQNNARV